LLLLAFLEGCQHCHPLSVGNLVVGWQSWVWLPQSTHGPRKMANLRNLRKKPPAPAKGNGRAQRGIRRSFIMEGREVLSSSEILDYTHTLRRMERRSMAPGIYSRMHRTLATMAIRVGRADTIGRPGYGASNRTLWVHHWVQRGQLTRQTFDAAIEKAITSAV
jgi:hypothetical protein